MSFESEFMETFKHSILIGWNEEKQKWIAECSILNFQLEADSYKHIMADIMQKIFLQDDFAFTYAEAHKPKLD
ncbi:hypothetical protein [Acinetobacter junii]|uniref:hypothetical protein n=1 Tax=Acinetobacter junii TaxID=40215 RepID=UPI00124FF14F|nr:hypothetical protein [Acinetobacter junii]